jgi:hypothetical protein
MQHPIGVLDDEDQEDPEAGQRRDRPTTQFAPIRLLLTRLHRHHLLIMSRSTGGFGATVSHLGMIHPLRMMLLHPGLAIT